jgi:hypothetical protein
LFRILVVALFWLGVPALSAIQVRRCLKNDRYAQAIAWLLLASVWLLLAAFVAFGLDEQSTYSFVAQFLVFAIAFFALVVPVLAGVQAYRAFQQERHIHAAAWLFFGVGCLSLAVFAYLRSIGAA